MKSILPILLLLFYSCSLVAGQGENVVKIITKRFDIARFNKDRVVFQKEEQYNGSFIEKKVTLDDVVDTLSNGMRRRFVDAGGYTDLFTPKEGLWAVYKHFYLRGELKEKKDKQCIIDGYIPDGMEYFYDERGNLIKEIDNVKLYANLNITPDRLFDLLNDKGIYSKKERPVGVLYIWFNCKKGQQNPFSKVKFSEDDLPFWEVTRAFLDPKLGPYQKVYKIDAKTGDVKEVASDAK